MKKFIIALIAIVCMASCEPKVIYVDSNTGEPIQTDGVVYVDGVRKNRLQICTVSVNNESHEYLFWYDGYRGSASHWEGCKYCKDINK